MNGSPHHEWAEWEDDLLRRDYATRPTGPICAALNRTGDGVRSRAVRLGLHKEPVSGGRPDSRGKRIAPVAVVPAQPLVGVAELMADLADARLEADALRILLAMSRDMLSEQEAGEALGVSSDPPPQHFDSAGRTRPVSSPLVMHLVAQAAIGMDIASKRLHRGGVLEGSGGSNQFVRRAGGER